MFHNAVYRIVTDLCAFSTTAIANAQTLCARMFLFTHHGQR